MLAPYRPYTCEDDIPIGCVALIHDIRRFDILYEKCEERILSDRDREELDGLYAYLQDVEATYWLGVDTFLVSMISDTVGVEFPAMRYRLGLLAELNL